MQLNGEKIAYHTKGIIDKDGHHYCIQCSNEDHDFFHLLFFIFKRRNDLLQTVYSIRKNREEYELQRVFRTSQMVYEFPFTLSEQQQYASKFKLMQSNIQRVSYYMRLQAQVRQK